MAVPAACFVLIASSRILIPSCDAVTDLAQQVGLAVPDDERSEDERRVAAQNKARQATLTEVLERAAQHYRAQLKGDTRAVGYLKNRGLTGEIAARFGLGYAPDAWHALASAFAHYDDPLLVEAGFLAGPRRAVLRP